MVEARLVVVAVRCCLYISGLFYSASVLGPVVAYIVGGSLLKLYTHFDTIDVSTSVLLRANNIIIIIIVIGKE